MVEVLSAVVSWRSLAAVILVFGLAPGFVLRIIALAFHGGDPRRREMIAELHAVPYWERPLWVAQQLEVAISEGLRDRFLWAATGRIIDRWHLTDGEQMNRDYPDTFEIPTEEDKAAIEPGDTVKAVFSLTDWGEKMWLEVVKVKERHLVCRLTSHPLAIPRLSCGDSVKVKRKEVVDILWKDVDYSEMFAADKAALADRPPFLDDIRPPCGCDACRAAA